MPEIEKKRTPEFNMKTMAENIRKLRERRGLSAKEFAEKLGINVQRVYELEKEDNQHVPGTDLLWRISTIFETSLDELLATEQANRMTFPIREFWEYVKGIEHDIMKVEWKHRLFTSQRYAVLRFFSLLHQTDHTLKFFVKARGGNEKDIDTLSSIQRFFKSRFNEGAYRSYEIYYESEIIAFQKGEGKYDALSNKERLDQFKVIRENLEHSLHKASPPLEVRILNRHTPLAFALYADRVFFVSELYYVAINNPGALVDFKDEFDQLWEEASRYMNREAVLQFFKDQENKLQKKLKGNLTSAE